MPKTYEPIVTNTVGTATSTVSLTSIPQTYTDLVFVISYSQTASTVLTSVRYQFNSDTAANYSITGFQDGSPSLAFRLTNQNQMEVGYHAALGYSQFISHLNNYSNTTTYKTVISRHANAGGLVQMYTGSWRSTSALTSINIACSAGTFAVGSTFTLYGIKAA
jgi:hypothetical protein